MKIVYYREPGGRIWRWHRADEIANLEDAVAEYNAAENGTAAIAEYTDDSFEAWMIRSLERKKRAAKEESRYALDALREVEEFIVGLDGR